MFQINVPVGESKPGETAPYRMYKVADGAVARPLGTTCTTVYEFIKECADLNGHDKLCMGSRDMLDIHYEKKKVKKLIQGKLVDVEKEWMYYEMSSYDYITFGQLIEKIHTIGRGLRSIGLQPSDTDRMMIFASTSAEWMQMYLGAQTQAIPIVTAYDSLGEKGLTHSLKQTGAVAVFTDGALLDHLVNPLKSCPDVRYIIHREPIDPADKRGQGRLYKQAKAGYDKILEVRPDIKIISMAQLLAAGEAHPEIEPTPPKPEHLTCIMYTSGSTGDPKGVVLTHANVVAGVGGISTNVGRDYTKRSDRVISFLPLAHIFELAFELIVFYWGSVTGYASVKTLTDTSCRNCKSDMREFQPTLMVGVAAVWELVKKGILAGLEKQPSWKQKLFWAAYNTKAACDKYSVPVMGSIIDKTIFKQIKAVTGGQMRLCLNGGSPISGATQRFISHTLCTMLIGYGLTETVANTCVTDPYHFEYDVAGSLVGSVTVKLIDVPEAGYKAKNGQGEVLIHGACVMKEYYKNDEETKNAFNYEAGWFSTGDIGQWMPNGALKLIDRKKNLVKTQNGEYIALEKLESVYRSNPLVLNICCYADDTKIKAIGIMLPVEQSFKDLVVSLGLKKKAEEVNIAEFETNKKVVNAVTASLNKTAKEAGFTPIEMLLGVVIEDGEWTPENGLVTSAQKLQRRKILAGVKDRVEDLYADN